MRIGLVCPYSLDVPGGVQNHVRDLAEVLIDHGHHVRVLAPGDDDSLVLPAYVETVGRAVPIPYNGSVARLAFGPRVAARTNRWLRHHDFDVLHVHEPSTASVSLLAVWSCTCPVVATFHTANPRSRTMSSAAALLRPSMEKISARIAVSEAARSTLVQHLGGEPVVIPNGVWCDRFAASSPRPEWTGRGTIAFLGRTDETRKGLTVLLEALPELVASRPHVRLLVAGRGDGQLLAGLPAGIRSHVTYLGQIDDPDRARLLASVEVYVAPQRGGESFGIVLVEAMSAGTAVAASDLPAFRSVLGGGELGALFAAGDAHAAALAIGGLLDDPSRRDELCVRASAAVRRYDWPRVSAEIEAVYATVYATVSRADGGGVAGTDWSR